MTSEKIAYWNDDWVFGCS